VFAGLLAATLLVLARSRQPAEVQAVAGLHFDAARGSWSAELRWPPSPAPLADGDLEVCFGGDAPTRILWLFRERMNMPRLRGTPPDGAPEPDVRALVTTAIARDRANRAPRALPRAVADGSAGRPDPADDDLIRSFFFTRASERLDLSIVDRLDWPHAILNLLAGALALATGYSAFRWIRRLGRVAAAARADLRRS